jgi:pyruvate formate lyase activating enzyme
LDSFLFDIRHYTIHDGPGIRTTVFFKGCPLRCWWCHNPESQESGIERVLVHKSLDGGSFETELTVGSWQSAGEVMKEIEKDEIFYLESGGGVTFSGGEPMMQADALEELLALCRKKGYHTAVDTSGHAEPAAFGKIALLTDLWLYDIKLMDDLKHVEYTGVSNELAISNLEMLARQGREIIIRFPLIPGFTDDPANLDAISALMKKLGLSRIDILPYHSIGKAKYKRLHKNYYLENHKEPGKDQIDEVYQFFARKGLDVKGNFA